MSDENDKFKHSKRLHNDETAIQKQIRIAKDYYMHKNRKWKYIDQPHRNHKKHILNCGDPRCYMCANPRKVFKEETMQEKSHKQRHLHDMETE